MNFESLQYSSQDSIVTIRLNRPERSNALSRPVMTEMHAALDAARNDPQVRVIVLTAAGKAFSSGADLKGGGGADITTLDLGESIELFMNPLIGRIREMPKPVVAAVNGVAAGVGCNLAIACDIVIAARSARFIENFARVGLVLDGGGSFSLPRLVGAARARAMAMLAEEVPAETAQAWGMIWDVVDDERLDSAALELARRLARMSAGSLAMIKRALHASESHSFAQQIELERDLQREAGRAPDFREAVAAFKEKRPPRFI